MSDVVSDLRGAQKFCHDFGQVTIADVIAQGISEIEHLQAENEQLRDEIKERMKKALQEKVADWFAEHTRPEAIR